MIRSWHLLAVFTVICSCTDETEGLDASSGRSVSDGGVLIGDTGPSDTGVTDVPLEFVDAGIDAGDPDAGDPDAGEIDVGPRLDAGCVQAAPPAEPQLTELTMPGRPRTNHAAVRLQDGRVLLAGGFSDGLRFDPDVELFDPETDMFSVGPDRPAGFAFAVGTRLSDGRAFVLSTQEQPSLLYNPDTGWTTTASTPEAFAGTLLPLPDGRVLTVGLDNGSDVYLYDPSADAWSVFATLSQPRSGTNAVDLGDGRLLFVGGGNTRTTEFLDLDTGIGSPGPDLNRPRSSVQLVLLLDHRVLVLDDSGATSGRSEIYDPRTNSFVTISTAPPLAIGAQLTRLCDGRVVQLGGRLARRPNGDSSAWLFDPAVDAWRGTNAQMPTRQSPSATLLKDGRVLVIGGSLLGAGEQPNSAFVFVPDAP